MKILVPTDLSKNNAAVIKYAYQLAQAHNHELVIFHSFAFAHVAELFTKAEYKTLYKREYDKNHKRLQDFVVKALSEIENKKLKVKLLLNDGLLVVDDIIQHSKKEKAGLIIVGTHGASGFEKYFLGTNTASLIKKSKIPVLALPTGKKVDFNLEFILGCNDSKLPKEWKKVKKITDEIGINAHCIHFAYAPSFIAEGSKKPIKNAKVLEVRAKIDYSLIENIEDYASKEKLGGVIMITNQNRSWFERLFLSSKTADLTYRNKLPVLSIPANN